MAYIYKIENKINNKFYIGSTIDFHARKKEHITQLNEKKHHSKKLQNAWNKYGQDNFEFIIMATVDNINNLRDIEQKFINDMQPFYNGTKIVTGALRNITCEICGTNFDTFGPAKYCSDCKSEMADEFFSNKSAYRWRYSNYETKLDYNDWTDDDWMAYAWDHAMEK